MNGRKVFVKKYKMYPITWDVVTCCGIPQCRLIKDGQYQADPRDLSMNRSSESGISTRKDSYDDGSNFIFTDTAKEISKAVASTENAKIIADIYGIDFNKAEKAILTKDNRIKISNESGNVVSVALNSFVLSQALKKFLQGLIPWRILITFLENKLCCMDNNYNRFQSNEYCDR